jgi:outer membrane protein TolC
MRDSNALIKLSLASSLLVGSLCAAADNNAAQTSAVAYEHAKSVSEEGEASLEMYLSKLKREEFAYDYEKVDQESSKLRDSWIQPIQLKYTLSRQDPFNELGAPETQNESATITIDQPIFQTGGIYYGIKFAQASRENSNYSIDQQKRILIKQAVELLMQIRQSELSIEKQRLQIANSQINLEQKREQYLHGQLDSGFLNNAIIEKNLVTQTLYDLETNKERLVSKFESISDLDYHEAPVPRLALLSETQFLEQNIDIKLIKSQTEKERYNKNVTLAKYLPKLSLQGSYNWQKNESVFNFKDPVTGEERLQLSPATSTTYFRYGLTASMPLDINSYNDYEASRVSYLKSKVLVDDTKRELRSLFEQVMQNLENFDKKIALARENRELYATLLDETIKLYEAGYKTVYDVDTLRNSEKIEVINTKIYEIDKQLELLNLYEKLADDV